MRRLILKKKRYISFLYMNYVKNESSLSIVINRNFQMYRYMHEYRLIIKKYCSKLLNLASLFQMKVRLEILLFFINILKIINKNLYFNI